MDPITIVTVIGSCSHLALRSMSLVADFGRLRDKLRHVERDVQMLVTQINAIKGAVNHLSQWLQHNANSMAKELLPEVAGVLECCTDLVALIGQHVDKVKGATRFTVKAGVAQLLGEDRLKEYQQMLQGQVQALSLLIQCLQLRSPYERKSLVQLVENNTTVIQGRFEINALQPTSGTASTVHPSRAITSGRKDSAMAFEDPDQLRFDRLAIEAPPSQEDYPNFFKDMPKPTADRLVSSERRCYTVDPRLVKVDPYADIEEDRDLGRKSSGFGMKFMGTIRKSVIQFDKLTTSQVLMDWPQWHREQRNRAIKDGKDQDAVLNSGLYTAVRLKHVDYINELFDHGARETARHGAHWTLMHHAVRFADDRIITLLLERRVSPDIAVERHGSPLHYALQHGNSRAVETLLAPHADPNVLDVNSRPPLYFALRYLLAIDHANKQSDPKWPFGKNDATRSSVCYELRLGVRAVLLLLHHGAQASSRADEARWPASIQQKLVHSHTANLPELIDFLADPLAPGIPEAAVDVYLWIQHALKDSLREAARGSVSAGMPGGGAAALRSKSNDSGCSGSTGGGSVKSVRFEEQKKNVKGRGAQKKTADTQRMEQLLGLT